MKSKLEPSEMCEGDGERAARAPEREGESAAPARPFKQEPFTTSDDGSLLDATHAVKQEADNGQSNLVESKLEFKQEPLTTSDDGSLLDATHAVKQEADIGQFNLFESKLESVQSDLSQFKQEPLTTSEDGSLLAAAHTVKQEADIGQFNLFESKLESVQSDLSQAKQEPPDTCGDVSSVDAKLDAEIKIEISHSIYRPSRAMERQSVEEEHSGATDQVNGAGWSTGAAGGASGAGCGVLGDCRSSSACGSRGVCRYRGVRTFRGAHRARGGCRGPRRVWPVSRTTSADQIVQRTVEQSVQHAPGTPTTSYTDKRLELAGAPEIEPVTTELTPVTSPMPKRQLHKISPKNMLRLGDKLIWTGLNTGARKACLARQVWPDSPTSTVQTKLGTEGQNFESATAATPLTTSVMPVIVSIQTLKSQPSSGRDEPAPPLKRPLEVGGNDSSVTPKRRMERPLESATSSSQSVSPSPPDSKIVSSRPENHKVIGSSCYDASSGPESDVEDFMPHAGSEDDEVDSEVNHYRNRGLEWLSRDVQPDMGLVDPQLIRLAKAVNAIEDEAIDRELPSTESIFEWSSDFTQFHGKKGAFISTTGPTIPTIDPLEIFLSIWDEEIMTKIVEATNEYATQGIASRKFPSKYQWKPTSISEMYLLFSIFVYQSVVTLALEKEYFGSNSFYGSVNCTPAIKYKRYIFLKKFLHFVNDSATKPVTGDAEAASAGQPLAAVAMLGKLQPVIDHCNAKFQSLYKLKQNLYIDESLTRWKGRLSWLQYIKTKHARFGVKSYELCESSSGYMWKFFIYADKSDSTSIQLCENIGASEGTGATSIALLKLVQDHNHMGHVLYLDYFYNSPALARILKNRGIDCVGTLWLDRKNVPSAVSEPTPDSMSRGQVIAVHSGDVAVMAWKDMKKVGMISTYHGPTFNDASQAGQGIRKPDIVLDYNKHMAGVNVKACDQRLSSFQLERHNKKWYMKMFHRLLNASLLNCYIIYSANFYRLKVGGKPLCLLTHREFRHKIVDALFRRFSARGTDHHRQPQPPPSINLRPILPQNHFQILLPQDSMQTKYRRCRACSIRGIRANSKYCCDQCNVPLCLGQCFKDYHTLKSLI